MSVVKSPATDENESAGGTNWRRRQRVSSPSRAVVARGEPSLWLTAGALAVALFMIVGLVALVVVMGGRTFWPARLVQMELADGRVLLGEVTEEATETLSRDQIASMPAGQRQSLEPLIGNDDSLTLRHTKLRVDNKRLLGEGYVWINQAERVPGGTSHPAWAMSVERTAWGRFVGMPQEWVVETQRPILGIEEQLDRLITFLSEHGGDASDPAAAPLKRAIMHLKSERTVAREQGTVLFLEGLPAESDGGERLAILDSGETIPLGQANANSRVQAVKIVFDGAEASWRAFERRHPEILERSATIREIERYGLGELSAELEAARMATVRAGFDLSRPLEPLARQLAEKDLARRALVEEIESRRQMAAAAARRLAQQPELADAFSELAAALNETARTRIEGLDGEIADIESSVPGPGAAAVRTYRQTARQMHQKTIALTARLAELEEINSRYTWQFATAGGAEQTIPAAEIVRAYPANQLGVWERLRVYFDRWAEFLLADPREANMEGGVFPAIWGTVAMTLIMTIAVVPFGVLAALFLREYAKAGPLVSAVRIAVNNLAGVPSIVFGVFGLGFFCYIVGSQVDQIFYPEYVAQNKPVFETGGLLWASLTLALLTLPVVIVATEEALASVPNSMREGSYACGASKWQTIRRIVLPKALPGIMTGMILAMARGAGEVAPLMLVGAVKIAPALPVDWSVPFLHPSRSFMHLGFHIYDLGFQSPDSEAAKPMVFTTTLLLITIIGVLNVAAIIIRTRLRRRFAGSQF